MKSMHTPRRVPGTMSVALCGLALVVVAFAVADDRQAVEASSSSPYRLVVPLMAADSAPGSPGTAAAPTATTTPTPTRTPTGTATATPTRTSTVPNGQSAYLLVQSWYDHIATTLYGQYANILNRQAAGLLSPKAAGQELFAFEPTPKAYKAYLDGLGAVLANASASCNYARQDLGLAAGWLSLMAGWGGLILTGAGDYFAQRQEASDNYFSLMSEALTWLGSCTGQATGGAPPSTTAVPTFAPTATPTPPLGGGGCFGTRSTSDWRLRVTAPRFSGDIFTIEVTPLTDAATESSFKVRVSPPGSFYDESSTKFFSFVGVPVRFDYGYDFFVSAPYPSGLYEVELRVDFLKESSLLVMC